MVETRILFKKYNYDDSSVLDEDIDIELPFRLNLGDVLERAFLCSLDCEKTEAIFNYYEELTGFEFYRIEIKVEKIILQMCGIDDDIPCIWAYCGITEMFR